MVDLTQANYAPESTEADAGFDPVPAGDYPVIVVDSELKDTKAGTGKFLKVTFEIFEGPKKNQKLWAQYNLINPNPDAAKIGHSQLKALSEACGKPNAKDSSELHNVPLVARVIIKKSAEYGDSNEIKKVMPYNAGAQATQASAAPAAAGDKPSWAS